MKLRTWKTLVVLKSLTLPVLSIFLLATGIQSTLYVVKLIGIVQLGKLNFPFIGCKIMQTLDKNPKIQTQLSNHLALSGSILPTKQLQLTITREETTEARSQKIGRKQQIILSPNELVNFRKFLPVLDYFYHYHLYGIQILPNVQAPTTQINNSPASFASQHSLGQLQLPTGSERTY